MLVSRFLVGLCVLVIFGSLAAIILIDSQLSHSRKGGGFFNNRDEQNGILKEAIVSTRSLQDSNMICVSDLAQCQSDLRVRESECYDNVDDNDNDGADLVSVLTNIFDRSRQILFGSDADEDNRHRRLFLGGVINDLCQPMLKDCLESLSNVECTSKGMVRSMPSIAPIATTPSSVTPTFSFGPTFSLAPTEGTSTQSPTTSPMTLVPSQPPSQLPTRNHIRSSSPSELPSNLVVQESPTSLGLSQAPSQLPTRSQIRSSAPSETPSSLTTSPPVLVPSRAPSQLPSQNPNTSSGEINSFAPASTISDCVNSEAELIEALGRASEDPAFPTRIPLCANISLTSEIQISGKSIDMFCANDTCQLNARHINRVLMGAPVFASFDSIDFVNGETDNYGGAAYLIGDGIVRFQSCRFFNNRAKRGGAIYMSGGLAVTLKGSSFQLNQATAVSSLMKMMVAECILV